MSRFSADVVYPRETANEAQMPLKVSSDGDRIADVSALLREPEWLRECHPPNNVEGKV